MNKMRKCAVFCAALIAGTAFAAPSVEITNVQQQYPWTNTVDITYTVQGVSKTHQTNRLDHIVNDTYFATFEAKQSNGTTAIPDVNGNTIFTNALIEGNGTFTAQWQPQANLQLTGCTMTPSVFRGEENAYLVINLETNKLGKFEWWYEPMSTQEASNERYNTIEYKTKYMVFRRIPAGSYVIGYNLAENQSFNAPNGEHTVTFPADYYLAIFKLTPAQYDRIVGAETVSTGIAPKSGISWLGMRGSASSNAKPETGPIATLASGTGLAVDFATHAMFETASRARSRKLYISGDTIDGLLDYAVLSSRLMNVGTRKPNAWGLYDVCGNGWEATIEVNPADLAAAESALPNGFCPNLVPGKFGYDRITCVAGNQGDYWGATTGLLHANSLSSTSGYTKNTGSYYNRLAIYPAAYYPNGGQNN